LESPALLRSVLLDRTPPTGRALLHNSPAPWLELQPQDSGSGVTAIQLIDRDQRTSAWQVFEPTMVLSSSLQASQVRFRDVAGNVSAPLPVLGNLTIYLPLATT
jgi:hypothetical protein